MINIVVEHAVMVPTSDGGGRWYVTARHLEDGQPPQNILHVLPLDALEWRMAEFNVDAMTAAKLVLAQGHGKVADTDTALLPTRSAARQTKLARLEEALDGGSITSPVGPPTVRALNGDAETIVDSGDGDALATLVDASPADEEYIAVKREWLDVKREELRRRATPKIPDAPASSQARTTAGPKFRRPPPDELRQRLLPKPPARPEPSGPADVRRRSDE